MSQEFKTHQCWSVSATSYLRNIDVSDRATPAFAVHYQAPPKRHDDGKTSISLNFPTLLVTQWCAEPEEVCKRVATILNAHWDDDPKVSALAAQAPAMVEVIRSFVAIEVQSGATAVFCDHCNAQSDYDKNCDHEPDCMLGKAIAILAQIDGGAA